MAAPDLESGSSSTKIKKYKKDSYFSDEEELDETWNNVLLSDSVTDTADMDWHVWAID